MNMLAVYCCIWGIGMQRILNAWAGCCHVFRIDIHQL
jgi:hypothetical protein